MDAQFVLNNFLNFSEIGLTSLLKYYYNSTKVLWELLLMMVLPESLSDMGTQDILIIIVMMPPECILEHHGGQSGYFRQYLSLPAKYLRHDRRLGDEMSAQNSLSFVYGVPHTASFCSLQVLLPYSCIISCCPSYCQDTSSTQPRFLCLLESA